LRILAASADKGLNMPDRIDAGLRRALLLAGTLAPLAPVLAGERPAAQPAVRLSIFGGDGGRVEGSGRVIAEERRTPGFNRLILDGPLHVRVQAADADRVVVHADDNITPLIETVVTGSTLRIGVKSGASFRTRSKVEVRVQARRVQGIVVRGSGEVRADRIETEVFEATIQGSGDIAIERIAAEAVAVSLAGSGDFRAAGRAASVGAVIDGAGDVHCADLTAAQVAVRIRGSGDARVHATEELKADIDGSGDVRYRGAPKISKTIRGSGTVEPLR
jgi:hypothetical protein